MNNFPPNRNISFGDVTKPYLLLQLGPQATPKTQPEAEQVIRKPKDHEISGLVNKLRATSKAFHHTDQLRERISTVINDFLGTLEKPT